MLRDELACKECLEMGKHLAEDESHLPADLTHGDTVMNKDHSEEAIHQCCESANNSRE